MPAFATIRRTIACVVCLLGTVSGQTTFAESEFAITGTVIDDASGLPVDQALIRVDGTAVGATSESDGSFAIRAMPPGQWSLTVERTGYSPRQIIGIDVVESFTRQLHISLHPDPVVLASQGVESSRPTTRGVRRVDVSSRAVGSQSVSELLESIPGVRVYGSSDSPGGTRISVGGEAANRVAVMLDGLPLSGGSDGAVDLSSIPVSALTAIEVYSGSQSGMAGDAAVGGAVNLITHTELQPDGIRISSSAGDWAQARQDVAITQLFGRVNVSVGGEYDQRRNPYEFIDVKSDTVGMRENARLNERRAFLRVGRTRAFEVLGYASRNERGAPGTIEQPLAGAFTRNKNARLQSSRSFILGPNQSASAAVWYEFASEYYSAVSARIPQHTYLREHFLGLKLGHSHRAHSMTWNAEIESRYRIIHGDDFQHSKSSFGDEDRAEYAVRSRISQHVWRLSLHGGIALDVDRDNAPGWSPRADVSFNPIRSVAIGAGWGRSFKRPLLVTAFWKGDYYTRGNPDLLPERAEEWDASIRLHNRLITIEFRYFERTIDDIVVWDLRGVPQRYTPVNLASAEVIGREDHVSMNLAKEGLALDYTHVYNDGRDHSGQPNYENNVLPFMPRHTHDCTIRCSRGPLQARLSGRWVSMREALRANSNRWQAPYRVFDAEVRLTPRSKDPHVVVFLRGENITDEAFELLEGYPSPARTLSAGLALEFD